MYDRKAFTEWVQATYPDEIEITVTVMPEDWHEQLTAADQAGDVEAVRELWRKASKAGASTALTRINATANRMSERVKRAAQGVAEGRSPLPHDGEAAGQAPPTIPAGRAGEAQQHANVRAAVTEHPITQRLAANGQTTAARAKWRSRFEDAKARRNTDMLDRLSREAARAEWPDLEGEAVRIFEAITSGQFPEGVPA